MLADHAFLYWNLFFLLVWAVLYVCLPRVRREMLVFSLLCAPLGPIAAHFYATDYFEPAYTLGLFAETMLNGFVNGGIAGSVYDFFRLDRGERSTRRGFFYLALCAYAFGTLWMYLGEQLGINSVYTSLTLFAFVGVLMLTLRPRLIRNSLFSGILFCAFHSAFYVVFFFIFPDAISWWRLENVSGYVPFGVPVEEIVWTFAWGAIAGPASELTARLRIPFVSA